MKMRVEVRGDRELIRALRKQQARFTDELAAALPDEARRLEAAANAAAPSETGELRASSAVSEGGQRGKVEVAVAYTDEKAAAVHEGVFGGRDTDKGRAFKWFERAFNAWEGGAAERIVARLRALVKGGRP